jgi:hypothetical protein
LSGRFTVIRQTPSVSSKRRVEDMVVGSQESGVGGFRASKLSWIVLPATPE